MALDSPTLKSFTHGNWQFPTHKNAEKCLDQAKIRVRNGKNILVRRSMLLGTPHEPLIQKLGTAWIVFHRLLLNEFVINNKSTTVIKISSSLLPSGKHTKNYGKSPFFMENPLFLWPFSSSRTIRRATFRAPSRATRSPPRCGGNSEKTSVRSSVHRSRYRPVAVKCVVVFWEGKTHGKTMEKPGKTQQNHPKSRK